MKGYFNGLVAVRMLDQEMNRVSSRVRNTRNTAK